MSDKVDDGYIGELRLPRSVWVRLWRYDVVSGGSLRYLWAVYVDDGLPYADWPRWDAAETLDEALWQVVKHAWHGLWRKQPERGEQRPASESLWDDDYKSATGPGVAP